MRLKKRLKSLIILMVIVLVLFGAGTVLNNIFLRQVKRSIQSRFGFDRVRLSAFPPALIIQDIRTTSLAPFVSARKITVKISFPALLSGQRRFHVIVDDPILRFATTSPDKNLTDRLRMSLALPFVVEKGLIKNGELYYWKGETKFQARRINALFRQRGDRFSLQAEAENNALTWASAYPQVKGKLDLYLEGQGDEMTIRRLRFLGERGVLKAEGRLKNPFDPELELQNSFKGETSLITDLFQLPFVWEGRIESRGELRTKSGELTYRADFSSQDLVLNDTPMGRVQGKLDFSGSSGGRLDFRIFKEKRRPERVSLRFKKKRVEGEAEGFYLDPIINFMQIPWPISSPAWGKFDIDNRRLSARVEFREEVLEPEGSRFPLRGLVDVDWDGAKQFTLSSDKLASSFAEVKLEAEIYAYENVDVKINGEVSDVKQARQFTALVLRKTFKFPEIRGRGRADMHIFGDFKIPQVRADFLLSPGGFDRFNAQSVTGEAEVVNNKLFGIFYFDDPDHKGMVDLVADETEVRGELQLERGRIEAIFPSLDIPLPLRGEASGRFEFYQTAEDTFFSGDFSSSRLHVANQHMDQIKGKLTWQPDLLSLSALEGNYLEGKVNGYVWLRPLSEVFDLNIQARDLQLSALYPEAQGSLSFHILGKGAFGLDLASGNFEIADLLVKPIQKTEARGKAKLGFTADHLDITLDGGFHPGENPFFVTLNIPFEQDKLNGEIHGSFKDFDLLLPWPGAEGQLKYLAELSGSAKAPQLKGAVDFSGPVLPFPRFAHAVRDYTGLVFVDNGELSVRSFKGTLGGGEVQGSGRLRIGRQGVEEIDLHGEGQNMLLSPLERTRGLADGSLHLIMDENRFLLEGNIFINQLFWRRELDEKLVFYSSPYINRREPEFFDDLNLNVRLRADDNAWLENSLGRLRGRFDLTIAGNVKLPVILGDIEAYSGEVYFQDREFKILRGRVSFFNPLTIEPYISFLGETYVKDYRVTFALDGLLDKLTPEFSSSPPLPPEDVLALLALGESFKRTYSYDRSTQLSTASLLSFQLSEEAKKRAESLFSIDRLRIDPFIMGSSSEMTARLSLGKKLSRNFFILYSTNLTNQREEITRIEWELTKDLSIIGMRDEEGRVSIDVKLHKRF